MIRANSTEVFEDTVPELTAGIAIASGKGGVGKTNVVANLAAALATLGHRVLVLDADFGLSNLDVLLGICPRYHVGHFLSGEKPLEEIVVDGPGGIRILPAASGSPELAVLDQGYRRALVRSLHRLRNDVDVLLIDTSAGISSNVTGLMSACSRSLVVTDPEPTSLVDAYALIKVMRRLKPNVPLDLLVNSVESEAEAIEVHRHMRSATERFLSFPIELFGWVESDPSVAQAVRHQKLVVLEFPESPAARSFHRLARSVSAGLGLSRLPMAAVVPFPVRV